MCDTHQTHEYTRWGTKIKLVPIGTSVRLDLPWQRPQSSRSEVPVCARATSLPSAGRLFCVCGERERGGARGGGLCGCVLVHVCVVVPVCARATLLPSASTLFCACVWRGGGAGEFCGCVCVCVCVNVCVCVCLCVCKYVYSGQHTSYQRARRQYVQE